MRNCHLGFNWYPALNKLRTFYKNQLQLACLMTALFHQLNWPGINRLHIKDRIIQSILPVSPAVSFPEPSEYR